MFYYEGLQNENWTLSDVMDYLGIVYNICKTFEQVSLIFFNVPSKIKILVEDVEILDVVNTCIDTMWVTS